MRVTRSKIITVADLSEIRKRHARQTIVLGTGCFDILHVGHLDYLERASAQADIFVLGINSDMSVRKLKGPTRPIITDTQRARLLTAFECIDYVFVFDETEADAEIRALEPNVFIIGEGSVEAYPAEPRAAAEIGAELYVMKRIDAPSTTSIIGNIRSRATEIEAL